MSEQNFATITSFFLLILLLHTLCKQTQILIVLKLGTHKGLIKAHFCTNFAWNLIKIYGVMIDFLRKKGQRSVMPTG